MWSNRKKELKKDNALGVVSNGIVAILFFLVGKLPLVVAYRKGQIHQHREHFGKGVTEPNALLLPQIVEQERRRNKKQ